MPSQARASPLSKPRIRLEVDAPTVDAELTIAPRRAPDFLEHSCRYQVCEGMGTPRVRGAVRGLGGMGLGCVGGI